MSAVKSEIAKYDPIPPMTKEQIFANRIGTPAYQIIFADHQPKTTVPKSHFASLVEKYHGVHRKSAGHGGMLPVFGTKFAGL
jgi:hypothetical protein